MPEFIDMLDMGLPSLLFIVGMIFFAVGLGAETSLIQKVPANRAHLFTVLGIVLALSGIGLHFSPVLSNPTYNQNGSLSLFSAEAPDPSSSGLWDPVPTASPEPTPTSSPTPLPPSPTPEPSPAPPISNGSCGSVTVLSTPRYGDFLEIQMLAINSQPNRGSQYRVGQASVGSTVEVVCGRDMVHADERTWVYVRYGGVEGWMSERFLSFGNAPPPVPTPTTSNGESCGSATVRSTPKYGDSLEIQVLAINSQPNRDSQYRIGQANVGSTVEVVCGRDMVQADERTWIYVRYGGVEGWMSERFLNIN